MMSDATRPTRYQRMSAEAGQMLSLGESGRYEFKRDADAVYPKTLATLANWVALDANREVAHLLVGVDEQEDPATGLVYGVPCGLPKGLDRAVARIQDIASKTKPIPVDVFIIEEAVAEGTPFIRIEIRPTMPPHFDDEGRRQTRQGRSTRALTDEELLGIYLSREAGSFAARFRHAGVELQNAVGAVGAQVDQISAAIKRTIARPLVGLVETAKLAVRAANDAESAANDAEHAAQNAESAASMAGGEVANIETLIYDLQRVVAGLEDSSVSARRHDKALESVAVRVMRIRGEVWLAFAADSYKRSSDSAERLAQDLRAQLSREISIDGAYNTWELRFWKSLLSERKELRGGAGTLKWWSEKTAQLIRRAERPSYYGPDMPDLRSELRDDLDKALNDPSSQTSKFTDWLRN